MTRHLLPEHFRLEVEAEGQVLVPQAVREILGLEPGDYLALSRNTISVRLDPYKEILEDLQLSLKEPGKWSYLEPFLRGTLTSLGSDGSVALPPNVLELHPGDRISLEIATEGLRPALYVYRADA